MTDKNAAVEKVDLAKAGADAIRSIATDPGAMAAVAEYRAKCGSKAQYDSWFWEPCAAALYGVFGKRFGLDDSRLADFQHYFCRAMRSSYRSVNTGPKPAIDWRHVLATAVTEIGLCAAFTDRTAGDAQAKALATARSLAADTQKRLDGSQAELAALKARLAESKATA